MPILRRNVWMSYLIDSQRTLQNLVQRHPVYLTPQKMTTICGSVFFFEVCLAQSGVYCWVNFVGSLDDAKNFTVEFHTANESEKGPESFTYNGSVRTLDENQALGGQG